MPGFVIKPLGGGAAYLHHHPSLAVADEVDGSVTLGTKLGHDSPAHLSTGSFVTISWPWLTLDASGTMGVYYFRPRRSDVICASSVAVAHEASRLPITGPKLNWGDRVNWDPLPTSRIDGLRRQFCDQALNLATGELETRQRSVQVHPEQNAIQKLAEHLSGVFRELDGRFDRILLPLTAGRDSRLLFAAAVASGVKFETFTNLQADRSKIDASIAAKVSKRYGVTHTILDAEPGNEAAAAIIREHSGGAEGDAGQTLARGNFHRIFRSGDVMAPGGVFEVGRRFYEHQFAAVRLNGTPDQIAEDIAIQFNVTHPAFVEALLEWVIYRTEHPIIGMDLVDAFYLDQRVGGWLSASRQTRDAYLQGYVAPANSWRCVDYLMSTTEQRRREGVIQNGAMEILVPGITSSFPINPPPFRTQVRTQTRRLKNKVRKVLKAVLRR